MLTIHKKKVINNSSVLTDGRRREPPHTHTYTPPLLLPFSGTQCDESVGKLFLGPKQRAFLSLMLLHRINIPPLNHSGRGAVLCQRLQFSRGPTAVKRRLHLKWDKRRPLKLLSQVMVNHGDNVSRDIPEWTFIKVLNIWLIEHKVIQHEAFFSSLYLQCS